MTRPGDPGFDERARRLADHFDPDERARQAEMDAARARELTEEAVGRTEELGVEAFPLFRTPGYTLTAKAVQSYIRSMLVPPAVMRLYHVGMGVTVFPETVVTKDGTVVNVENPAPPRVQVDALKAIAALGVPASLKIADAGEGELAGVIALGEADLDQARREAHGERYVDPSHGLQHFAADGSIVVDAPAPELLAAPPARPMAERIAAGEFELVEIEETPSELAPTQAGAEDAPPPRSTATTPEPEAKRVAREILAARRAKRAAGRGKPANGHGDHGGNGARAPHPFTD